MTDRAYKKEKERVERRFAYWVKAVGLSEWEIHLSCHRELLDGDDTLEGTADIKWEYMDATIILVLPLCGELNDWELDTLILHELSHIFVAEIEQDKEHHHVEHVCTVLSRAFRVCHYFGKNAQYLPGGGVDPAKEPT